MSVQAPAHHLRPHHTVQRQSSATSLALNWSQPSLLSPSSCCHDAPHVSTGHDEAGAQTDRGCADQVHCVSLDPCLACLRRKVLVRPIRLLAPPRRVR
eukprot:1309983-Rhodomonas_salina.2